MAEESIPSLRRSIEAMKAKKKKLQDMYTDDGEQLRYFEEKEEQIQEFIRELNNNNKELQKQIDARKASQSTRNSFLDKQHQETLEKLYMQHQKLLEKKQELIFKEKQGPSELQQLEDKYNRILKEKQDLIIHQRKLLQSEESRLREMMDIQDQQFAQISSLQNGHKRSFVSSSDDDDDSDNEENSDEMDQTETSLRSSLSSKLSSVLSDAMNEQFTDPLDPSIPSFAPPIIPPMNLPSKNFGLPSLTAADFCLPSFISDDTFSDDELIPPVLTRRSHKKLRSNHQNSEEKEYDFNPDTQKLMDCFKVQLSLMEKKNALSAKIKTLEQLKQRFETEIEQLRNEKAK